MKFKTFGFAGSAVILLAQSLLWMPFASAQSPARIIRNFGLLGTWADNCRENAGPSNPYAIFSVTSRGTIELRNDFGPDYEDMLYRIVDARPIGHFRLSLRQLLVTDDQIALDNVMMKAADKIRVWSSQGADGTSYVQYGSMPSANDQETGWMERCNVRWTRHPSSGAARIARSHSRARAGIMLAHART
jgi:hypothetical protein